VPNLVDPGHLEQLAEEGEPVQATDGIASICVAARLDRLKRVDTLLKAAAGLQWELPWRIDVLGDGNQRAELEALSRTLGIADRVFFRGWMNNPYPIMSRATVSVLCSEYEGFSNSVIEAMVLRTPVITSLCTTDARDMCERGAALGFPVGDHLGLRAELMRVLEDETLRARLKTKAWAYVQRHTIHCAIKEYEKLVFDAIERHRSGY
jgi:glycosyltransferase involved in cell wall biosynthesis